MAKNMTRVTTIGSDVIISGGAIKVNSIQTEAGGSTTITLKDSAATTLAVLNISSNTITYKLHGAEFPLGLTVNIAATGQNILVIWSPA